MQTSSPPKPLQPEPASGHDNLKAPNPGVRVDSEKAKLRANGKPDDQLTVVCFGASSGGFEAYCLILSLLPSDTGMAYIIVHHQPADGKSLLVDILPRMTDMPVVLLTDGVHVQADHVYVVPAGMQVTMEGDEFRIGTLIKTPGWPKNITIFLQSLAEDRQKRAIAVILSGFDSDGAAALKSIKDAGGIVFAQEFRTAKQPDMPESAVRTGCVDRLLQPAEIAFQLARIGEERAHLRENQSKIEKETAPTVAVTTPRAGKKRAQVADPDRNLEQGPSTKA
jgi:two-component system, chemotaxis family, protein-glutamate methylesterase/glutaminase